MLISPVLDLESFTAFSLPSVLVPPEVIELENEMGEDAPIKKEEWPEYFVRLFENDVSFLCFASSHRISLNSNLGVS